MIPQTLVQCSGGYKCVSFDLFRPQNVCNFELTFLNTGATPPWLQICIFWPLSASECLQSAVNRNFTSAHDGFHAEGVLYFFVFSNLRRIFALLSLCMCICLSVRHSYDILTFLNDLSNNLQNMQKVVLNSFTKYIKIEYLHKLHQVVTNHNFQNKFSRTTLCKICIKKRTVPYNNLQKKLNQND